MHGPSVSFVTGKWGDRTVRLQLASEDHSTSSYTLSSSMKFFDHEALVYVLSLGRVIYLILNSGYSLRSGCNAQVDFISTYLIHCSNTSPSITTIPNIVNVSYQIILYLTFLFSLFVFVSAAGQYFSILTGPINIMFSSGFCSHSLLS